MSTKDNTRSGMIRSVSKEKLWKNNLILFLALIFLIFVLPVIPVANLRLGKITLILIVVSGLFAAEFNKRVFRILFMLGSLVISLNLIVFFFPNSRHLDILAFFSNTLFFTLVTFALVSHVARAKTADGSTILCAINSYLLIGLTSSLLLLIIELFVPQSFNQINEDAVSFSTFLYYGFVTLTTLGYGDISPATPLARSMATFIALFGQLYLAIIMAMIIGKFLSAKGENQ